MPYQFPRTIYLADTDAAGVVYFTKVLEMCHEAYEDSLAKLGIDLRTFVSNPETAFPIVHAEVDFLRPLFCGDRILIQLTPQSISETEFEVTYTLQKLSEEKALAKAVTRHVCIHPSLRKRIPFPEKVREWLQKGTKSS